VVQTRGDAMLIGEGKKLQEPFLSLICLTPNDDCNYRHDDDSKNVN